MILWGCCDCFVLVHVNMSTYSWSRDNTHALVQHVRKNRRRAKISMQEVVGQQEQTMTKPMQHMNTTIKNHPHRSTEMCKKWCTQENSRASVFNPHTEGVWWARSHGEGHLFGFGTLVFFKVRLSLLRRHLSHIGDGLCPVYRPTWWWLNGEHGNYETHVLSFTVTTYQPKISYLTSTMLDRQSPTKWARMFWQNGTICPVVSRVLFTR